VDNLCIKRPRGGRQCADDCVSTLWHTKKRENRINNSIPVYTCNTLIYIGFLSLAPYVYRGVLKDISIDTSMTQVR